MPPRREPAKRPPAPHHSDRPRARELERRRRQRRRLLPLAALALVAFAVGLLQGAGHTSASAGIAKRFVSDWERGDYRAMHRLLSPQAQRRTPVEQFQAAYLEAADEATATGVSADSPGDAHRASGDDVIPVRIHVKTRVFKQLAGTVEIPLTGSGDQARVDWRSNLTFPGLRPAEQLRRRSIAPKRGALLARDGRSLAQGPADQRGSNLPGALDAAGRVEVPQDPDDQARAQRRGFPDDYPIGVTGLERSFDSVLGGRPGGQLDVIRDGGGKNAQALRTLAVAKPVAGHPVRTTIDPKLQATASTALAGRFGGLIAIDPRKGNVLALAGIATSDVQAPGSTFKIVTATAALQAQLVRLDTQFPVTGGINIDGKLIKNAFEESCGGTFEQSFAQSCNSVFAPVGVKVGAERLVATAKRYGWNRPTLGLESDAAISTIPPAAEIAGDLDVAVSAIGQGKVVATPLQMAIVSAAVARGGVRAPLHIVTGPMRSHAKAVRVSSPGTAATVRRLMVGVVANGTGTTAAIPGVVVAGKTGTAELGRTEQESKDIKTNAWFTGFAPARGAKIVAAGLLVKAGAGGDVAAPMVREVLAAALQK